MVKISAFTQGRDVSSSRFRIRQYIPHLLKYNISVTEHCPLIRQYIRLPRLLSKIRRRYLIPMVLPQIFFNIIARIPGALGSYDSDAVWISRSFLPGMDWLATVTKKPRVLDVDDAVWLAGPQATRNFASRMDCIIAGNEFLADWFSQHCRNIHIVPTAIDPERFHPKPESFLIDREVFTIGWTGASGNFGELEAIQDALANYMQKNSQSRLMVIADRKPNLKKIPARRLIFHKWNPSNEAELLHHMDVGIMPLKDNQWNRGKCSFKMLQYMASGLPVVVSPVGMNKKVLGHGACGLAPQSPAEWVDAFAYLHDYPEIRKKLGEEGRRTVLSHYSLAVVARKLAHVFRGVISK